MADKQFDLITIGNALVDVLCQTGDAYIKAQEEEFGMQRVAMNLVEADRALALYDDMQDAVKMPGGSAGNTMACFTSFGGRGAYIGKVADDALGDSFAQSLKETGVHFVTAPLEKGASTGRCMIFVTPDGERTMNTYLGAARELTPADIDPELIAQAAVTYLEGYLYDPPRAMEAFIKAARAAHDASRRVALTLSDKFCVDRHRQSFRNLVQYHTDILFANEDELMALYEVETLDKALQMVGKDCAISATTRSDKGSIIIQSGRRYDIPPKKTAKLVDSTGAGDAYAAGFLYGFTHNKSMEECGWLGSLAATEVIQQMGPRPSIKLSKLLDEVEAA
jgi:sugar/nucleoside kinase (ribokinase family)